MDLFLNYHVLRYFNTTTLLLYQIITISLSGNHDYYTRSKYTISAEPPDFLSALFENESNLMQNITNSKEEVIDLEDIII